MFAKKRNGAGIYVTEFLLLKTNNLALNIFTGKELKKTIQSNFNLKSGKTMIRIFCQWSNDFFFPDPHILRKYCLLYQIQFIDLGDTIEKHDKWLQKLFNYLKKNKAPLSLVRQGRSLRKRFSRLKPRLSCTNSAHRCL